MSLVLGFKAITVWLLILGGAFGNAALRELLLIPWLGKVRGLTLSGTLLSALVLLIGWLCLPWLGTRRAPELAAIGVGWCLLTIVFDLLMGRAQGKSTAQLLDAYLFRNGNIFPAVLLVTLAAPYAAAKLRGWL